VAAVVQQDYVAAASLLCDLTLDYRCRRSVPVVAGYVPHDGFEAEFAGDAKDGGAACSEGRAEEVGMGADCIVNGGAAVLEFAADFRVALEDQRRVSEGVVTDDVAGLSDGAGNFRFLVDITSDEKKSCVDVVFG